MGATTRLTFDAYPGSHRTVVMHVSKNEWLPRVDGDSPPNATRLTGYWDVCPDPSYLSPPGHLWGDVWTILARWKRETSTAPEGIDISRADQNCQRSLSGEQNATAKKTGDRILHIKRGVWGVTLESQIPVHEHLPVLSAPLSRAN